jgi:hypothetical protein
MANDFYLDAAAQRANEIAAERQAALADLAAHRANGDTQSAAQSVQQLANLQAEQQNLQTLCNDYVAAQRPPSPPELSPEERAAKPWHRMDWNDVVELTKTSKWAKDIRPDDENMIRGWHEVRARRGRGE